MSEYHGRDARRVKRERRKASRYLRLLLARTRGRCHWCRVPVVRVGSIPPHLRVKPTKWAIVFWRGGKLRWVAVATVDHVVPLVDGGESRPGNLVAACCKCNGRRNAEQIAARRKGRWPDVTEEPGAKG